MTVEGVMVSYNYSEDEQAKITTVSASGIKFSNRWVLTHGSFLSPLKQAQILAQLRGKSIVNEQFYMNLPEIYVTCEKPESPSDHHYTELTKMSQTRHSSDNSYLVRVMTGRICHVWKCGLIDRCVEQVLYSWTIGHKEDDVDNQTAGKALLSVFVLIDLGGTDIKTLRPLSELYDLVKPPPDRGAPLEIHSTPFGCEVFLNAATRGSVCAVVGSTPTLLLTDAAAALGSEGGPVFNEDRSLSGMVVCAVSWCRGEWVGLTLTASLCAVLADKLALPVVAEPARRTIRPMYTSALESIDCSIVLVRCGLAWGAGVYLGGGFVVTCAHVVRNSSTTKISVFCQGVKETAIVRYKTADDKAYDLALLYSNAENWKHLVAGRFSTTPAVKGESVIAAGYPYFNENNWDDLKPTITQGQINNVSPSLIQTSCCVQSGFSGGAIYRLREVNSSLQPEVVGIIVCNAKTIGGACYPYINMAAPAQVFVQLFYDYMRDRDEEKLMSLENKKEIIQSQWRLMPYRSKI